MVVDRHQKYLHVNLVKLQIVIHADVDNQFNNYLRNKKLKIQIHQKQMSFTKGNMKIFFTKERI